MHRAGAPSSDSPTDRRRSDCLSESHQPRALRPRCTRDTRASRRLRQAVVNREIRSLRNFLYNADTLALSAVCSTKDGTKDSPSRVRFRPLPRLTFRFRVRPPGRASSYSRPVLGAAAIYLWPRPSQVDLTTERPQIANDRRADEPGSTSSSREQARASAGRSRSGSRGTALGRDARRARRRARGDRRGDRRAGARRALRHPRPRRTSRARSARARERAGAGRRARRRERDRRRRTAEDDEGGDRFDDLVRTNLNGTYYCVRAALRHLAPGPEARHVVVISSILARIAVPGYTGYSASKAGLLGLVRSLAAELAGDNVQVNAICPGWVETDMARRGPRPARAGARRRRATTPTARRCGRCRSGAWGSPRTSRAPSPGCSRRTRVASPARRSTRTAAPSWA